MKNEKTHLPILRDHVIGWQDSPLILEYEYFSITIYSYFLLDLHV